jgi:hypothetical protein
VFVLQKVHQYDDLHFINLPYVTSPIQAQIDAISTSDNVVWAINQAKTVLSAQDSSTLDKSLQLRFLIHFVGDIHQPLHIATQYGARFTLPGGDQGGNDYIIQGTFVSELHAFMDSGAGQWQTDPVRPLSEDNSSFIANTAVAIMQEFPQ